MNISHRKIQQTSGTQVPEFYPAEYHKCFSFIQTNVTDKGTQVLQFHTDKYHRQMVHKCVSFTQISQTNGTQVLQFHTNITDKWYTSASVSHRQIPEISDSYTEGGTSVSVSNRQMPDKRFIH